VESYVEHPNNGSQDQMGSDAALLRLRDKVPYNLHVQPICLPGSNYWWNGELAYCRVTKGGILASDSWQSSNVNGKCCWQRLRNKVLYNLHVQPICLPGSNYWWDGEPAYRRVTKGGILASTNRQLSKVNGKCV
jgi:hypothetical protein